jgi:pyruvate kinase
MLTKETAVADEPLDFVLDLYDLINADTGKCTTNYLLSDVSTSEENEITDYIIYNAYRISKEKDIKAIICPTQT